MDGYEVLRYDKSKVKKARQKEEETEKLFRFILIA